MKMKIRHNMIQDRIKEAVIECRGIAEDEIRLDSRVVVNGSFDLEGVDMEEFAPLRPDMSFWVKEERDGTEVRKLMLVEISIPFGRKGKAEEYDMLEEVRMMKQRKDTGLVNFLKDKLREKDGRGYKYEVVLKLIIVSSLGAVPKRTLQDFRDILGKGVQKAKIEIWGKRLCVTAIRGSYCVWMKAKDGVYNLMKEKREVLNGVGDDVLEEMVDVELCDVEDRDHVIDVQLIDDVEEYEVPRRLDIMENGFVEDVEDGVYRLIDDEEKGEINEVENVFEDVSHSAD
jgi:hypothetical protein